MYTRTVGKDAKPVLEEFKKDYSSITEACKAVGFVRDNCSTRGLSFLSNHFLFSNVLNSCKLVNIIWIFSSYHLHVFGNFPYLASLHIMTIYFKKYSHKQIFCLNREQPVSHAYFVSSYGLGSAYIANKYWRESYILAEVCSDISFLSLTLPFILFSYRRQQKGCFYRCCYVIKHYLEQRKFDFQSDHIKSRQRIQSPYWSLHRPCGWNICLLCQCKWISQTRYRTRNRTQ